MTPGSITPGIHAMKLTGDAELVERLRRIGGGFSRNKVLPVLRAAARPIRDRMAQLAPVGPTGKLAASPKIKALPGDPPVVVVRPDYRTAPHAHLVEFGTRPRTRRVGGLSLLGVRVGYRRVSTGSARPRPYARTAFIQTSGQARSAITAGLTRLIEESAQ